MDESAPDERSIVAAFGLRGRIGELVAVRGAWSNRVYRLVVGSDVYATKEMRNPWDIVQWREWLDEAWRFEQRAIEAGIVAPTPVPAPDGSCLAEVDRRGGGSCSVRLHHWVDGTPVPLGPATRELAMWAGETLARLHALRVAPANRAVFPTLNTINAERWPLLVAQAASARVPWAPEAAAAAATVALIASMAIAAGDGRDEEVMTHGDIDQKNVLLVDGQPVLCDWDVAAPFVPRREVADVAMSFGVWERFDIAREVIGAYRSAGGELGSLTSRDIAQPLMIGIDWIALNIERALRLRPVTDHEAELGESLVPGLLRTLHRSIVLSEDITSLLTPT